MINIINFRRHIGKDGSCYHSLPSFKKNPIVVFLFSILLLASCKKFIEIDQPRTELIKATVFADESSANAAVIDLYYSMSVGFSGGGPSGFSLLGALSADEVNFAGTNNPDQYLQFNDNDVQVNNTYAESLWSNIYSSIYKANSIVEGLETSEGVPESRRKQMIGEAKFFRALSYFYLVNLWGEIPLILTTNYQTNNTISSSTVEDIYSKIVEDLKNAKSNLPIDYAFSEEQRTRANTYAATALLARVYLFLEDWNNAEVESNELIANSNFALEMNLGDVFKIESKEAIFQYWSEIYPNDFVAFNVSTTTGPRYASTSPALLESFEADDTRKITWTQDRIYQGVSYNRTIKYKNFIPPIDYLTVLRVVEQYLIRAESRAQQDKLIQAAGDINAVRNRAGLLNTLASTKEELLDAVLEERRHELFNEQGHRWLDLKRTGLASHVLAPIKPKWDNDDVLYPIPQVQLINNPNTRP